MKELLGNQGRSGARSRLRVEQQGGIRILIQEGKC
jgi:hypothetical protein